MRRCPHCAVRLEDSLVAGVKIEYCPRCYGMWFEQGELELAQDHRDRTLRWLDVDLWKDPALLKVSRGNKKCPEDRLPLAEVEYGDSGVKVDVCSVCRGAWLDRGEFKGIMVYLRDLAQHEVVERHLKALAEEVWEVFTGPEMFRDEILDVLSVLKLLSYRFAALHPKIAEVLVSLPR
ncbi:MAG: zf-TFIIB domain-containing protein [bacterium]|nr:zf-TFIIB domain-containing protein [bacterium]